MAYIQRRVFLTTPLNTNTSFARPYDWNPLNNKVECVGSGGRGAGNAINPLREGDEPIVTPQGSTSHNCGTGGGGGAWAYRDNCNPTSWPVTYMVTGGGYRGPGASGYGTYWNQTVFSGGTNAQSVAAECGQSGAAAGGQIGSAAGTIVWPQGNAGGTTGTVSVINAVGRGGGGGGGPHGIGATASSTQTGTTGDGGNAAAGAAQANGTIHFCWDATHGICGGSGGANNVAAGATVAPIANGYGGGGGGMSSLGVNTAQLATGSPGLIVITWQAIKRTDAIIMV